MLLLVDSFVLVETSDRSHGYIIDSLHALLPFLSVYNRPYRPSSVRQNAISPYQNPNNPFPL
jgi:hypothetical protein